MYGPLDLTQDVLQVGFWRHMEVAGLNGVLGVPNASMLFLAAFMMLFSVVIALFKDIPGAPFWKIRCLWKEQ